MIDPIKRGAHLLCAIIVLCAFGLGLFISRGTQKRHDCWTSLVSRGQIGISLDAHPDPDSIGIKVIYRRGPK